MEQAAAIDDREYCRFGKRDLDGFSWIAPLVNNPFGDRLNIEMRHEQLFFLQGDRVLDDIGYSDKGTRFSERDFGKPITNLEQLKANGYWLVGRSYDPGVMREALRRQQDGYYYSFFSNQCQDWADRLEHVAQKIERERGIAPAAVVSGRARLGLADDRPVSPTQPASVVMGVVALAIGVAAFVTPIVSGNAFAAIMGGFFLATGVSQVAYALHGRDWSNFLPIFATAVGHLATGVLMLLNRHVFVIAGSVLLAIALGAQGAWSVGVALFSRPRVQWLGSLLSGAVMIGAAFAAWLHWPSSSDRVLGGLVGISLITGGWSTIWLRWKHAPRRG